MAVECARQPLEFPGTHCTLGTLVSIRCSALSPFLPAMQQTNERLTAEVDALRQRLAVVAAAATAPPPGPPVSPSPPSDPALAAQAPDAPALPLTLPVARLALPLVLEAHHGIANSPAESSGQTPTKSAPSSCTTTTSAAAATTTTIAALESPPTTRAASPPACDVPCQPICVHSHPTVVAVMTPATTPSPHPSLSDLAAAEQGYAPALASSLAAADAARLTAPTSSAGGSEDSGVPITPRGAGSQGSMAMQPADDRAQAHTGDSPHIFAFPTTAATSAAAAAAAAAARQRLTHLASSAACPLSPPPPSPRDNARRRPRGDPTASTADGEPASTAIGTVAYGQAGTLLPSAPSSPVNATTDDEPAAAVDEVSPPPPPPPPPPPLPPPHDEACASGATVAESGTIQCGTDSAGSTHDSTISGSGTAGADSHPSGSGDQTACAQTSIPALKTSSSERAAPDDTLAASSPARITLPKARTEADGGTATAAAFHETLTHPSSPAGLRVSSLAAATDAEPPSSTPRLATGDEESNSPAAAASAPSDRDATTLASESLPSTPGDNPAHWLSRLPHPLSSPPSQGVQGAQRSPPRMRPLGGASTVGPRPNPPRAIAPSLTELVGDLDEVSGATAGAGAILPVGLSPKFPPPTPSSIPLLQPLPTPPDDAILIVHHRSATVPIPGPLPLDEVPTDQPPPAMASSTDGFSPVKAAAPPGASPPGCFLVVLTPRSGAATTPDDGCASEPASEQDGGKCDSASDVNEDVNIENTEASNENAQSLPPTPTASQLTLMPRADSASLDLAQHSGAALLVLGGRT